MSSLFHVLFILILIIVESHGFCQEMEIDVLMATGGVSYTTTQNNQVVVIKLIGPDDPDDANYKQKIEVRINGIEVNASRATLIRIVKIEIADGRKKLSTARQSFLSILMATLFTDLKIRRWGMPLFKVLHEGNWQHAFLEREPPPNDYNYGAPIVLDGKTSTMDK